MSEVKQIYYVYYSGYCGNSFHERVKVLWDVDTTKGYWNLVDYDIGDEVVIDKYDGTEFIVDRVEIYKEKNNRQLCEGECRNDFERDFLNWVSEWGNPVEYDYEKIDESCEENEMERADRIEQENLELKKENAELKKKIAELEKEKNA